MKITARFQEKLDDERCRCLLCPHRCRLKPGQHGICRVRINEGGVINLLNYGQVSSLALDPIEKKPLFHYYPGSLILSTGSWGCNFSCPFCQNHSIAHGNPITRYIDPEEMLALNLQSRRDGSIGMAFTYNEPMIWYEYILDTARLLKKHDLKVVLVSNGYINPEPLQELLPFIDAANVDLKSFQPGFYRRMCKAGIEGVKESISLMAQKIHLELTTLIIPGENDQEEEMEGLSRWVADLDPDIPLHLSAYHPAYKMTVPPTSPETLHRLQRVARRSLRFVYAGNLAGERNDTSCPDCGQILIERRGYKTFMPGIQKGNCANCGLDLKKYLRGLEE